MIEVHDLLRNMFISTRKNIRQLALNSLYKPVDFPHVTKNMNLINKNKNLVESNKLYISNAAVEVSDYFVAVP